MSKFSLPALLVAVLWATPAVAQVRLEWQFTEGETFFVERVTTQKSSLEVNHKTMRERRDKTWLWAISVRQQTQAGQVLAMKIDSVTLATPPQLSGEDKAGRDDKLLARLKGNIFTATVTRRGKVVKFDGYGAFVRKVAEKQEDTERVLKALLSEESLREEVEEIFNFLPEKAVRQGDKWKRQAGEPLPPFGSLQSSIEYILEEDNGRDLGIAYTLKMTYKPPGESGDLFQVVKGGLKEEEGKGSVVFDTQRGRLVSNKRFQRVRGEVVIEAMGKQTHLEFTSENSWRIRLYAK